MLQDACILCGSEAEFSVSKYYPATYDSPAEGGDIEDWTPSCECSESPCVDEGKHWQMMEEEARDALSQYDGEDSDAYDRAFDR